MLISDDGDNSVGDQEMPRSIVQTQRTVFPGMKTKTRVGACLAPEVVEQ